MFEVQTLEHAINILNKGPAGENFQIFEVKYHKDLINYEHYCS